MKSIALIMIAALGVALAGNFAETRSAPQDTAGAGKWAHVQVVSYGSGLTGFFDSSDGKFYLYGADVKTPFMVTQLETLGEPMKVIKAPGQ